MTSQLRDEADLPVLLTPSQGLPQITDSESSWQQMLAALAAGSGPIAVDVERAQSFRYSAKAYLVQLRRLGSGTFLIDPLAFERVSEDFADFSALRTSFGDQEWIIHAATQDLTNLVELGISPRIIFDTELAGRLLGLPRVSLGAMAERYCGQRLLKEHGAVDWSTRPIPDEWIAYAALDVELLHQIREAQWSELVAAGKDQWARQEFDYLYRWSIEPRSARPDEWRRTSGMHQVRSVRGAALVRELVEVRDEIAQEVDKAPGRILPDKAITELASMVTERTMPSVRDMRAIPGFKRRSARRYEVDWLEVLSRVATMNSDQLPELRLPSTGAPMPRQWDKLRPEAASRWNIVRPLVVSRAEELSLPVENLISPSALREVLWAPPAPLTIDTVEAALAAQGARRWQQQIIAGLIVEALS